MTDISNFTLKQSDIKLTPGGLARPECVLADRDGTIFVSDNRGAITRIAPDGTQTTLGTQKDVPNGIAMDSKGTFYIANIGNGKLYSMTQDGTETVMLDSFEGQPLGAVNFVHVDGKDRIWLAISTTTVPRHDAMKAKHDNGYILRFDTPTSKPVKAATGFHFTNEVRIDADWKYFYVVETAIGRVSRLALHEDGSLGPIEPFGPDPLFEGAKPDGCAFDAEGNLWVTEIEHHQLWVIQPSGKAHMVYEDKDGSYTPNITSLAFAGPDLKTVYLGTLKGDKLAYFTSPVAGAPMVHWNRK